MHLGLIAWENANGQYKTYNMKLENQFPTREQSERLKELGIVQQGMHWIASEAGGVFVKTQTEFGGHARFYCSDNPILNECCTSHFTVAELSVMLDAFAETYKTVRNTWSSGSLALENTDYPTQAQASAARLIELLENGQITAETCNLFLLNS